MRASSQISGGIKTGSPVLYSHNRFHTKKQLQLLNGYPVRDGVEGWMLRRRVVGRSKEDIEYCVITT